MAGDLPGADKMKSPSVRVHADLLAQFDKWCDENGTNRSAAIRRFMAQCVADGDGSAFDEPDHELLVAGYRAIRQAVAPDGTVPGSVVISRIAERTRVDKEDVSRVVLRPLRAGGYIEVPTHGVIFVPSAAGVDWEAKA